MIKYSLELTKELWNQHLIRKQAAGKNVCHGKPFVLFNLPEKFGAKNHKKDINIDFIPRLKEKYTKESKLVDKDFIGLIKLLDIEIPVVSNAEEALCLFKTILEKISEYNVEGSM